MNLQQFFREHPKAALAFSGGVDSAYLLYAAIKYGAQVRAYYVKTAFQPQFELEDAIRLVQELGAVQAYNLDGGNSACLYLMGRKMNNTNSTEKRPISDIIYFASAWDPDAESFLVEDDE